ncbi:unnamed protein product [Parajaminaea phylloscopi]
MPSELTSGPGPASLGIRCTHSPLALKIKWFFDPSPFLALALLHLHLNIAAAAAAIISSRALFPASLKRQFLTLRRLATMPAHSSRDPWNRLYEGMLPFHENFRRSHAYLQRVLPASQSLPIKDLQQVLERVMYLVQALEGHHHIEETYIFPLLAKKMPSFGKGAQHTAEHEVMHHALEALAAEAVKSIRQLGSGPGRKALSEGCGSPVKDADGIVDAAAGRKPWPREVYDGQRIKELEDKLADALFPHLSAEEQSLKGPSLQAAGWTLKELSAIPM